MTFIRSKIVPLGARAPAGDDAGFDFSRGAE
jgi:hypothetical protein